MRTTKHIRPQFEPLEGKALLSAGMAGASTAAALVSPITHTIHLMGTARGNYTSQTSNPDVGTTYGLTSGSGRISPLGRTSVTGNLHTVGFIRGGQASGTLFLSDTRGSLTLKLTGEPKQDGPAPLPDQFDYTITSGSGKFANAKGSGSLVLTLDSNSQSTATPTPGKPITSHGRYTLVFVG